MLSVLTLCVEPVRCDEKSGERARSTGRSRYGRVACAKAAGFLNEWGMSAESEAGKSWWLIARAGIATLGSASLSTCTPVPRRVVLRPTYRKVPSSERASRRRIPHLHAYLKQWVPFSFKFFLSLCSPHLSSHLPLFLFSILLNLFYKNWKKTPCVCAVL